MLILLMACSHWVLETDLPKSSSCLRGLNKILAYEECSIQHQSLVTEHGYSITIFLTSGCKDPLHQVIVVAPSGAESTVLGKVCDDGTLSVWVPS